jgi:membrane protease YdiL (CAAX protease family)
MTTKSNKTAYPLPAAKIILFTIACIAIFILVAIICDLLTSWIAVNPVKIMIRELLLRAPLTVFALHLFAHKVVKAYDPATIYGRLTLLNTLKWVAIGSILPASVWVFYYLFHFIIPFQHAISLSTGNQLGIWVKWISISFAAGLTEEVLFRGHLFMLISNRYSKLKAILITSTVFGLVHIYMLTSFSVLDMFIVVGGGIIAGIMFSCIYQYTKVIWYAALVHGIWDIFFIGRIINIATKQADANQTIAAFKLTTHHLLLTGNTFGIEAGLPCLIAYLLLSIYLYTSFRRKNIELS